MGLFSGDFFDDVLGLDARGGGIAGSTGFAQTLGDPLEDAFKSISGQTAQDSLKKDAAARAARLEGLAPLLDPTIEAGQRQIPFLEESASAGGFGANIGDILSGGALDPLIAERQRASQAALSGAGLRRSGAAATEAARIPANLSLGIEQELNRRRENIASRGQAGIGTAINLQDVIGSIISGGTKGGLQARAAGLSNIIDIGSSALSAGGGAGGFGGGGLNINKGF